MFKVSLWSLHCKSYLLIFEKCHGQWPNCEKITKVFPIPSVQSFSRVWLFLIHGLQHARPPCPSPTPGVYQNSCALSDAIQRSHPLSSPTPPALNLSQHQGLFQWVNSSHRVAEVLELQFQHQSFQWIFRTDFL